MCMELQGETLGINWRGYTNTPGTPAGYSGPVVAEDLPGRRADADFLEVQIVSINALIGAGTIAITAGAETVLSINLNTNTVTGQKFLVDVRGKAMNLQITAPTVTSMLFRWIKAPPPPAR